jgi:soluble lytic murein transglycosylase-like protein
MMRVLWKFAVVLMVAIATCAHGADVAMLRNGFSISHQRRDVMGSITRLYTSSDGKSYVDISTDEIDHFERDLSPTPAAVLPGPGPAAINPQTLDRVVSAVSDRHHLDPDFITSVIRAESGFNAHAVSRKGAQGLMQLMPQTSQQLGVKNPFDPSANLEGGTRYLRELLERYNFDVSKALAAYNAGPHRVEQYRGVPPYYETRAYVARIVRDYNRKKLAERKTALTPAASSKRDQPNRTSAVKQVSGVSSPDSTLP